MSHFAKVENGIVTNVIVAEQDFIDSGAVGEPSSWIQTSYNNKTRGVFAGLGYHYFSDLDIFLPPKPYESWSLNTELKCWESPVPYPGDGNRYMWDEASQTWIDDIAPLPGE